MDALQLPSVFHRSKVTTDGLLGNTESIGNVDNIYASVSGEQVGDRLVTSHGLRVLDGHCVLSLVRR